MQTRAIHLRTAFTFAAAVLFCKVLLSILYQYRWYFPPDFDNGAFLIGRRDTFEGMYPVAFYLHIVLGPIALLLATFHVVGTRVVRFRPLLGRLGKIQTVCVYIVALSGLVMAPKAFAGPIAGAGFASLAVLTALTVTLAAYHAAVGGWAAHRLWARRCVLLLYSPLLLRLLGGLSIVTQVDSLWTYQWNAWISWLVPLAIHEWWWCPQVSPQTSMNAFPRTNDIPT